MGMVVGALLCREIEWLDGVARHMLTPTFIFTMLFFTFCRVDARRIRLSRMHVWLLLFQAVGCLAVYYALAPFDGVVAQGAMICILAPVAMAAVVIGGMLGANIETMAAYSLLCNVAVAFGAPFVGQMCRTFLPRVSGWVSDHSQISFYVWLMSLTVVIGRTTCFLLDHDEADRTVELALAGASLVICLLQFGIGRRIGRRYGDTVAGGQSLGQKNTVLAVWMSQSFLDPISSVAPTAYIVWQNFVNSYQIYKKDRETTKNQI